MEETVTEQTSLDLYKEIIHELILALDPDEATTLAKKISDYGRLMSNERMADHRKYSTC